jgi:hypothetical protein
MDNPMVDDEVPPEKPRCVISGCSEEAEPGRRTCPAHTARLEQMRQAMAQSAPIVAAVPGKPVRRRQASGPAPVMKVNKCLQCPKILPTGHYGRCDECIARNKGAIHEFFGRS